MNIMDKIYGRKTAAKGTKITTSIPTTIEFNSKISDHFSASLLDKNGNSIGEYSGYVPDFIPNEYGDYLTIKVDVESGRIINWKRPTNEELEKTFTLK